MPVDRKYPPELVRDLMTVGVPTCSPSMPVKDLAHQLLETDWEGVVVLDIEGHAAGIVTRKELVAAYALGKIDGCIVEDIMRPGVPQIPPDIPLAAAAHLMNDQGLRIFFLMHHAGGIEYPAAMITYEHILRHLASRSADDLRDLGIKAERESPVETFIKKRDAARRRSANDLESGDNHAC